MNIKELYEQRTHGDISFELTGSFTAGWLIAKFEEQLNQLPKAKVDIGSYGIQCYPKTREECVKMLQLFGGRWTKTPDEFYKDKIRYSQKINNPFDQDWELVLAEAQPPASCQIIEVEELVPASIRKVKKMVCPTGTKDDEENVTEVSIPEAEVANA